MCLTAVRYYELAIQHVPAHLRDREMYLEAVKQSGEALE